MQNEIAVKIEGSGSGPVVSSSCAILVLVIFNHHVTVKDSRKGENDYVHFGGRDLPVVF
jgi:hypothetical protein